jgi:hypothetical protein
VMSTSAGAAPSCSVARRSVTVTRLPAVISRSSALRRRDVSCPPSFSVARRSVAVTRPARALVR